MIINVTIKRHHNISIDLVRSLLILFSGSSFHIVKPITFFRSPAFLDLQHQPWGKEPWLSRSPTVNLMLTLEVPWTCHPPPPTQGILVHLQGQQNFASTVEPFHLPGASSGNLLATLDLAAPAGHQKGSWASRGLEAGELSASSVPGPRGRGTEWVSSEHCLLGQPEHIPSPGRSQR